MGRAVPVARRHRPTRWRCSTAMTLGIRHEFTYVRRPEKGVQRPEDTLRQRSGSCRDFALFMMEAVRSLGFAARFVSGYIFVPEATGGTVSGGATHAWMQVYLPGAGWVDFDPTNSMVGNRNLIRVAVAWDHGQALPLWGSYIGAASVVPRDGRQRQRRALRLARLDVSRRILKRLH